MGLDRLSGLGGGGDSVCRFCAKKKKKSHTHTHTPTQGTPGWGEGRGQRAAGWVRRCSGRRLWRVHSGASLHLSIGPSCNVLLFVMVEQLCVNISKSCKKTRNPTASSSRYFSPLPGGYQAAVVQEARAQILGSGCSLRGGRLKRASGCATIQTGWAVVRTQG